MPRSRRGSRIFDLGADRHDDGTDDVGGTEPPRVADVVRKAPSVESRGLARVLQGPHGNEVDPLRGISSRGALLRMDRGLIKRLDDRRYALKFTPRLPTSKWSEDNRKRWVELEAAGLLAAAGLRAAPDRQHLRTAAENPGSTGVHRQGTEGESKSLEFFGGAGPNLPASLCRLDSYRQAARNAGEAHSGIDCSADGRKKAGLEVRPGPASRKRPYLGDDVREASYPSRTTCT